MQYNILIKRGQFYVKWFTVYTIESLDEMIELLDAELTDYVIEQVDPVK